MTAGLLSRCSRYSNGDIANSDKVVSPSSIVSELLTQDRGTNHDIGRWRDATLQDDVSCRQTIAATEDFALEFGESAIEQRKISIHKRRLPSRATVKVLRFSPSRFSLTQRSTSLPFIFSPRHHLSISSLPLRLWHSQQHLKNHF